ncbi:multicopper oxidase domain-containing protein [Roseovarius arcticus]|uniref:multicopper oxidase domain-containing protein n=1 Tax=Roseovarius arcticus TaxID=2547404 RepID=UPI001BB1F979|nr:multicopper oxidase domain-containing protein [Roseovarius arcticus]
MRSSRRNFLKAGATAASGIALAQTARSAGSHDTVREGERRLRHLVPPNGSPPDLLSRPSPPVTPFGIWPLAELSPPVARPLFTLTEAESAGLGDEAWWDKFREQFEIAADALRTDGFATSGAWSVRGEELTADGNVRIDIGDPPDPAAHQRFFEFRPRKFYINREVEFLWSYHAEYGDGSYSWGYHNIYSADDGSYRSTRACSPGPTFHTMYGEPILTRRINDLPNIGNNPGNARLRFALPSTTSHLHNAHTASESDGYPSDWINPGEYWDHHYANFPSGNDDREKLSTLWYHDHRMDFTASNVYAGLDGFYMLFDERDAKNADDGNTGDKDPSWLLPSHDFDIPLIFHDLLFAQEVDGKPREFSREETTRWTFESSQDWSDFAGTDRGAFLADGSRKAIEARNYTGTDPVYDPSPQIIFDGFNTDGIIGDRWTVNRRIQPALEVTPRKYRLRLLNGGPSRFYEFYLHAQGAPEAAFGRAEDDPEMGEPTTELDHPFIVICGDGNFQPNPVLAHSIYLGVAQRVDVIVDFSNYAGSTVYLVNRLEQEHGRGPNERKIDPKDYATDDDFFAANAMMAFKVGDLAEGAVHSDYGTPEEGDADPSAFPLLFREFPPVDFTEVKRDRLWEFDYHGGLWTINGKIFDPNRVDAGIEQDSAEIWTMRNSGNGWHHPIHSHFTEFLIIERDSQPFLRGTIQTKQFVQDSEVIPEAAVAPSPGAQNLMRMDAPNTAKTEASGFTGREGLAEIFKAPELAEGLEELGSDELRDRLVPQLRQFDSSDGEASPEAMVLPSEAITALGNMLATMGPDEAIELVSDLLNGNFDAMKFRSYDLFAQWVEFLPLIGLGKPKVDRFLGGARRDVALLLPNTEVVVFARWKDFMGRHIMHCHNVVHEDHAMMVRWDIVPQGAGFDTPVDSDLIAQSLGDAVKVHRREHIETHPEGGAHAPDDS